MIKKTILLILIAFNAKPAAACYTFKPNQISTTEELVIRSKFISLAKLTAKQVLQTKSKKNEVQYTFEVLESLKGKNENTFILVQPEAKDGKNTDFSSHTDPNFWKAKGGRAQIRPDCRLIASFEIGKQYLIFSDDPYHVKSFELILSRQDKWLLKVRDLVAKK